MGVLFNVFIGLAVVTSVLLVGAYGAWYYALQQYGGRMSGRALVLMRFVVPLFMVLIASPVADVVLWGAFDFGFPTIGFPGTVAGMVGSAGALGYVLFDMQGSVPVDRGRAT